MKRARFNASEHSAQSDAAGLQVKKPLTRQLMDLSVALGNHIIAAGMLLSDAIALEDPAPQYQIILVARQGAVDSPALPIWMAMEPMPEVTLLPLVKLIVPPLKPI